MIKLKLFTLFSRIETLDRGTYLRSYITNFDKDSNNLFKHNASTVYRLCLSIGLTLLINISLVGSNFILDFDDLPVNNKNVNNYFTNFGVSFNNVHIITPLKGTVSGNNALKCGAYNQEFHSDPLIIIFSGGQSVVRMNIGLNTETKISIPFELRAYDKETGGKKIGKTIIGSLGPGPTAMTTVIVKKSNTPNIRRIELQYKSAHFEVIDNLEFDNLIIPPPDTQPPVVTIFKPVHNTTVNSQFFELKGEVYEETALKDLILTIKSLTNPESVLPLNYSKSTQPNTYIFKVPTGVLWVGENTVRVTATDAGDNVKDDYVIVNYVEPPPVYFPTLDLYPSGMEITQGIVRWPIPFPNPQFGWNSAGYVGLDLVEGKRTIVRVFSGVQDASEPVNNVFCELTGQRGGIDLPGSPLSATTERITVDPSQNLHTQRENINFTWNFVLPDSWTNEGYITLYAHVNPQYKTHVEECYNCYNQLNKKYVSGIRFIKMPQLNIYPLAACVRRTPEASKIICDLPDPSMYQIFSNNNSDFAQLFPVAHDDILVPLLSNPIIYIDGDFTTPSGIMTHTKMCRFLKKVRARLLNDWVMYSLAKTGGTSRSYIPINHIYLGFVPPQVGGTVGLAGSSMPAAVFKFDPNNLLRDSWTAVHEIGHTLGRPHTPNPRDNNGNVIENNSVCDEQPDDENLWYPHYTTPNGNPYMWPSIGQWGIDTRNMDLKNPSSTFDVMSYCEPKWISEYTYFLIQKRLKEGHTVVSKNGGLTSSASANHKLHFDKWHNADYQLSISQINSSGTNHLGRTFLGDFKSTLLAKANTDEQQYILVCGEIDTENKIYFEPFYQFKLPIGTIDYKGEGVYRLELWGLNNKPLFTRSFDPGKIMDAEAAIYTFEQLLPFIEGTVKIVLINHNQILAERVVSHNKPSVRLISPNGGEEWEDGSTQTIKWKSSDADNDRLYHNVFYSIDCGKSWRTLETNLIENKLVIDPLLMAGSDAALVKILTTDGVNTASDESNCPFYVSNKHPLVSIIEPLQDKTFEGGRAVSLLGLGTDLEDGPLPNEAYNWSSDRDGVLGTGKKIEAHSLSYGRHKILLSVVDSQGKVSSDQVAINIKIPSLLLEFIEIKTTPVCNQGTSHTIELRWRDSGLNPLSDAGPLHLIMPDGFVKTFNESFPIEGSLLVPILSPLGGSLVVRLEARSSDSIPTYAEKIVEIESCSESRIPHVLIREAEGWCCIKGRKVFRTSIEECTEANGVFFTNSLAAQQKCREYRE